jgi:thiol-disulfide isomerase/thioredoxin
MYLTRSRGPGYVVAWNDRRGSGMMGDGLGEWQTMPTASTIYGDPANQRLVHELTDANFWNIFYDKNKVLVVDFWATWCPPCNDVAKTMVEVAKKCFSGPNGPVKFYHIQWDSNVNPKIYTQMGFEALPVVFFYYTSTGRPPTRSAPLLEGSLAGENSFRPLHRIYDPDVYLAQIRNMLRRHGHPVHC